jgi:hypothetical protein
MRKIRPMRLRTLLCSEFIQVFGAKCFAKKGEYSESSKFAKSPLSKKFAKNEEFIESAIFLQAALELGLLI